MPSHAALFGLLNLNANPTGIKPPNQTLHRKTWQNYEVGMVSAQEEKIKTSRAIPPAGGLLAIPQGAKPVTPTPT